jgi:hypothetical protein
VKPEAIDYFRKRIGETAPLELVRFIASMDAGAPGLGEVMIASMWDAAASQVEKARAALIGALAGGES